MFGNITSMRSFSCGKIKNDETLLNGNMKLCKEIFFFGWVRTEYVYIENE